MPNERLLAIVSEVMVVEDWAELVRPAGGVKLRGQLMGPAAAAHAAISERLAPLGYIAMLERKNGRETITLIPYREQPYRPRRWLAAALLVATLLSTLFVGGTMVQSDLASLWRHPFSGWPFALSLIAILGVHESGHYLVARRHGVQVSLPYFIPMPFGPFGTMGAFISMKSPPLNRRHLLRIGVAGPLSGLLVGLVVLIYGLSISHVGVIPPGTPFYREGNSIAYLLAKFALFGQWLPRGSLDVNLSPVAFAGWAGLLVTGLNLIPAGQLDGGHVAYALLGHRARYLTWAMGAILAALGLLWPGWFLWVLLVLFLGSRREVLLDDITPLSRGERLLGLAAMLAFALLFVPVPLLIM